MKVIIWHIIKPGFIILGIIWEIFEYLIANNKITRNLLIKYWPIPVRYWDETNIWNKIFDMIFNLSGYYVGNMINL